LFADNIAIILSSIKILGKPLQANRYSSIIDLNQNGGYHISDLESCIQYIAAIEPCYGAEGGNACRIYTRQGQVLEDRRRVQTILKRTVDFYGGSLISLRKKYGQYLGSRQSTPLPLNAQLVLVPIKMRCPPVDNDSATGYVNACNITGIESLSSAEGSREVKCILHLSGGLSVPSFFSTKKTEKRLLLGRLALNRFCQLQGINANCGLLVAREKKSSTDLDSYATIGKLFCELVNEK
jgi:hypothetical protein